MTFSAVLGAVCGLCMLFFTSTVSPRHLAQRGNWAWVVIFGGLRIPALVRLLRVA